MGTLQGFMWVVAACAAVASVLGFVTLTAFNRWWDAPVGSFDESQALEDWDNSETAMSTLQGLTSLAFLVVFVLMILWMHQAHRASQRLWLGQRTWSSGWTVGGWFIPVANLLIPKLVLGEIEAIGNGRRTSGNDSAWRRGPTAAIGWVWWILMYGGLVAMWIGGALYPDNVFVFDPGDFRASYTVRAVALAAIAVGAVCGAFHVGAISNRLSAEKLARA